MPSAFGAYLYWPDHLAWSTQLHRLISYVSLGGADFSEIHSVARSLTPGDDEGWYSGFVRLAGELDVKAAAAERAGHAVTAMETWDRACVYFRMAATFRSMRGEVEIPAVDESRRCFRSARALDTSCRIEQLEIPYDKVSLPAYFLTSAHGQRPAPTVIVLGGIDAFSEEMYFKIAMALVRRGYRVLLPDGPGQGESRRRKIGARSDYEVAISALVDYLCGRGDVDPERIALIGSSMGGYFAARGAAFERRLCACVVWGAFYGVDATRPPDDGSETVTRLSQAVATFAVSDLGELTEKVKDFNLEGVATQIVIPTLVLHGGSDIQVPLSHARRLFEDIASGDKHLILYPPGGVGCTHCQLDSPLTAQFDILNWLDERLFAAPTGKGTQ